MKLTERYPESYVVSLQPHSNLWEETGKCKLTESREDAQVYLAKRAESQIF